MGIQSDCIYKIILYLLLSDVSSKVNLVWLQFILKTEHLHTSKHMVWVLVDLTLISLCFCTMWPLVSINAQICPFQMKWLYVTPHQPFLWILLHGNRGPTAIFIKGSRCSSDDTRCSPSFQTSSHTQNHFLQLRLPHMTLNTEWLRDSTALCSFSLRRYHIIAQSMIGEEPSQSDACYSAWLSVNLSVEWDLSKRRA